MSEKQKKRRKRHETDEFRPKEYYNWREIMQQGKSYEAPSVSVYDLGGRDVITFSAIPEKDYDLGKADIFGQDWGMVK